MNTRFFLVGLLVLVARFLPAQSFLLFGGSAAYVSQDTAAQQPWSATSFGVMGQSYIDLTGSLGVYSAAALGFVVASQDNGVALDPGQYQTLSFDVLLGAAYRIGLGRLTFVAGAGIYFGSTTLNSLNTSLSSFAAGGVGPGIGVSFLYSFSYNWGVGANVNAAYYFTIPSETASPMAPGGIIAFGGVGVTYFFRPSWNTGPGISRYAGIESTMSAK